MNYKLKQGNILEVKEMKKRVIWTDAVNVEEWEQDFRECFNLKKEETIQNDVFYPWIEDTLAAYLDDEKFNLNIETENPIVCIANLGLWNGKRIAVAELSCNINSIFNCKYYDSTEIAYCGKDIQAETSHHDGTNHYLFREMKAGRSLINFFERFVAADTEEERNRLIKSYTRSIAPYVKEVYGW